MKNKNSPRSHSYQLYILYTEECEAKDSYVMCERCTESVHKQLYDLHQMEDYCRGIVALCEIESFHYIKICLYGCILNRIEDRRCALPTVSR